MDYREVDNYSYNSIDEMCERHPEFFEGLVSDHRSENHFKTREKTKLIIEGCSKLSDLNLLMKLYDDMERLKRLLNEIEEIVPGSVPDELDVIPTTQYYPKIKEMVSSMIGKPKISVVTS